MTVSPRNAILEGVPDAAVAEAVFTAVTEVFERDAFLFQVDANERSITRRLAVHLTPTCMRAPVAAPDASSATSTARETLLRYVAPRPGSTRRGTPCPR